MTWNNLLETLPDNIRDLIEISKDVDQRPDYHPEITVYNHIKKVTERALRHGNDILIVSAIFHDLGKMYTTKMSDKGHWTSPGHEAVSVRILDNSKKWVDDNYPGIFDIVRFIVGNHMRIQQMDKMRKQKQDELKNSPYFDLLKTFSMMDGMIDDFFD